MDHDDPSHRRPPRAQPLQPDRPGRGNQKQDPHDAADAPRHDGGTADGAERRKEQSETAVENTREGYGGR